jgi:hypothetical protein
MIRICTICIVAMLATTIAPHAKSANTASKERFVIDFENVEQGHWLASVTGTNFRIFTRPEQRVLATDKKGVVGGTIKVPYLAIEGRKTIFETAFSFSERPTSLSLDYAFNVHTNEVSRYSFRCRYSDGSEKVVPIDVSPTSQPPGTFTCEARGQALINEVFVAIPATADAPDMVYIDNVIGN